jgi:hypothetical protein
MFEYELPMTDVIPTGIINHPFWIYLSRTSRTKINNVQRKH